jgi:AcrR family transcriptional regulator
MRKFSMSDVCAEAGVSRGTLYRYFKSKDEVLEAIGAHMFAALGRALRQAVVDDPDPSQRLRVVLQAMVEFPTRFPPLLMIIHSEPQFALTCFREALPQLATQASQVLNPVLEEAPAVRDRIMSATDLGELFTRLMVSTYLIPSLTDLRPAQLGAAWQMLVGTPLPVPAVTAAPR